jgi:predicted dinucleotide-utilizing enzyme
MLKVKDSFSIDIQCEIECARQEAIEDAIVEALEANGHTTELMMSPTAYADVEIADM